MTRDDAARLAFEDDVRRLVGRTLKGVQYWDVHNYSDASRVWDFGNWHHAVMGVELMTDTGPFTVTWTNRFFPYGVEVFNQEITEHLVLSDEGPEGWDAAESSRWTDLMGHEVLAVETFWEHLEVGPAIRQSDNVEVSPAEDFDVPVALRLQLQGGDVWFVAGVVQWPNVDDVFVMGDEILVVFEPEKLVAMGFPVGTFTGSPA